MKYLYTTSYKKLKKATEGDSNKWNDISVQELEELVFLKCPYYPKPSVDLIQSLWDSNDFFFLQNRKKQSWSLYGTTTDKE